MAKVENPLHSLSVSGSIGGTLTFKATANGSVVTKKALSYPQITPNQLANQQVMINALAAFKTLNVKNRGYWQDLAAKYHRSAWTCFFSEYQYQVITPPDMPLIPEPNL